MPVREPRGETLATLAAIGDVGLVGSARARAAREGWDAPLAALAPVLRAADVGFANLEFPVGEAALVKPGGSREFFHDVPLCSALRRAGVRVVSLANNHMMDCGPEGLLRTLDACRAAGLLAVGAGRDLAQACEPALLEVRGRRLAVLAFAQAAEDAATANAAGVAPLAAATVASAVRRARESADLVVVSAHWGSMYVDYPPPRVLELAHAIAQAGADVILGHHPHVLQGIERRGRTLVLYSLGDAAFNCRAGDFHAEVGAQARLESAVFTLTLASDEHGLETAPMRLDDDGFPAPATGAAGQAQRERLARLSAGLADAGGNFAAESAPALLQYELQSLATYVRQGRWGRVARLLGSVRPRHLPLLWQAVVRRRRST